MDVEGWRETSENCRKGPFSFVMSHGRNAWKSLRGGRLVATVTECQT